MRGMHTVALLLRSVFPTGLLVGAMALGLVAAFGFAASAFLSLPAGRPPSAPAYQAPLEERAAPRVAPLDLGAPTGGVDQSRPMTSAAGTQGDGRSQPRPAPADGVPANTGSASTPGAQNGASSSAGTSPSTSAGTAHPGAGPTLVTDGLPFQAPPEPNDPHGLRQ